MYTQESLGRAECLAWNLGELNHAWRATWPLHRTDAAWDRYTWNALS